VPGRFFRRPGPLVLLSLAYLLLVSGLMIWRGISVSPDYLLLILVPVAVLSGRFLGFLRDWVPFVVLFLGYEALRGIAPKAGFPRHYGFVIRLDKAMSGGMVSSQWLQAHLGSLRWLAIACTVVYFCHFLIPVGAGMVLWLVDRVQFLRYTVALLAMSFAGFVVFLVLPVAPPWLAARHRLLTGVHSLIALPSAVSPIYNRLDPDVAAAFPSLHAAYPLLAALALWPAARRGAVAAFAWSGMVWFSVRDLQHRRRARPDRTAATAGLFADASRGELHAVIHERLPLDQAVLAHQKMEAGEVFGRIVLTPS
jgi:hypothetical protein